MNDDTSAHDVEDEQDGPGQRQADDRAGRDERPEGAPTSKPPRELDEEATDDPEYEPVNPEGHA